MKINKLVNLRIANPSDAAVLYDFVVKLDEQSDYLLYGQSERNNDTEKTKLYLEKIENNYKSAVFIAENEKNKIVGFICGEKSLIKRISHVMKVNIGILKEYRKSAISRQLLQSLLDFANKVGIVRVEATVIKNNSISLNLSKKFGFEIDGLKKNAIKINDQLYDEYLLSLQL